MSFLNKKTISIAFSLLSIVGYGAFVFAAPNLPSVPLGGYTPGIELDPVCAPNTADCLVTLPSGGSGWGLTGNSGTDSSINFIGTTDAQDFVVGTNGIEVGRFYNNAGTSAYSVAFGGGQAESNDMFVYGQAAGQGATSANNSNFLGAGAGYQAVYAAASNFFGYNAGNSADGANNSNFFGNGAGYLSTSASNSNFFGQSAGSTAPDAAYSNFLGYSAGNNATSASYSNFVGSRAGYNASSASNSTFIGSDAGFYASGAANSIILGTSAGANDTVNNTNNFDDFSILIGNYTSTSGFSNSIALGSYAYNTATNQFVIGSGLRPINDLIITGSGALFLPIGGDSQRTSYATDGAIRYSTTQSCLEMYSGSSWACVGGGASWGLTGNTGTDSSVNFIGTTDAQDFVIKVNGSEIAGFGQVGNTRISNPGGSANGQYSVAINDSVAMGNYTFSSGNGGSFGDFSSSFGFGSQAISFAEQAIGMYNTSYTAASTNGINLVDRLMSIGNGTGGLGHNAYTLWKDGSFAYNDDNFQNDNPGTEQNMFYFNYGNHDGLGGAQTKRAIRLGSAVDNEWDINSANVGNRSIAIGFGNDNTGDIAPIADGLYSIAIGQGAVASGNLSKAFGYGNVASGQYSTAFGVGSVASGTYSISFGFNTSAPSFLETAFGTTNTAYIPQSVDSFDPADRLLSIGNGIGIGSESDAFTILKNGQTGIAIDNFEANTNGNIFQVGDGGTGVIGYVDTGTGAWVAVSDARKKNSIQDLSYGLDTILALSPKSYIMNESGEHSIGFLAQDVLPVVPEAVFGSESKGYGMSYATLVPVTVKAIQQLNLKLTDIQKVADATDKTFVTNMIAWFANKANGINKIFVKQLCLTDGTDEECITMEQLRQLKQGIPSAPASPAPVVPVVTPDPVVPPQSSDSVPPVSDPIIDPTSDPVVTPDPLPVIDPAPAADPVSTPDVPAAQ